MGFVWSPLLRASAAVIAIMLVLNSLVALAGYLFLSNYKESTGPYSKVWAYVEGYADLDEYGCLTGWIFYVRGYGGGTIESPASGTIKISTPPDVVYYKAKTVTEATVYVGGSEYYVRAIAAIIAPPGAC